MSYFVEIYGNINQVTYKHANQDQHGLYMVKFNTNQL